MEPRTWYYVYVYPPESVKNNPNATLHFDIEKLSMKDMSAGYDRLQLGPGHKIIDLSYLNKSYTPPGKLQQIRLFRKMVPSDVRKQKLELMPGFKLYWNYSGVEVEKLAKYYNAKNTKAFVRNNSIIIILLTSFM